jgi:hypothetical protein
VATSILPFTQPQDIVGFALNEAREIVFVENLARNERLVVLDHPGVPNLQAELKFMIVSDVCKDLFETVARVAPGHSGGSI